jgi:hypothetical protein
MVRPFQSAVSNTAGDNIIDLCEYRFRRGILCKHCVRSAAEFMFLNAMRDMDSPDFEPPEGYDEE